MQAASLPAAVQQNSDEADTLMLELAKRFMAPDRYGLMPPRQFLSAFYDLIDLVSQDAKTKMATMLSRSPLTPRAVAHYLSLEPVSVGGDMLLHSPALGNLDLLRIAQAGTAEHRKLVAERRGRTAAKPATAAVKGAVEDAGVKDSVKDAGADMLRAAARGGRLAHDVAPAPAQAVRPASHTQTPLSRKQFLEAIDHAARHRETATVLDLLQSRFSLDAHTTRRVFDDAQGDAFAVLLKADDTPASDTHRLQLLLFDAVGSHTEAAVRALRVYEALSVQECVACVSAWREQGVAKTAALPAEPARRRESHADAMADRHGPPSGSPASGSPATETPATGTRHPAPTAAQTAIEHRRYAF